MGISARRPGDNRQGETIMPVKRCQSNKKPGYKWGDQGNCYTGKNARQKALRQGRAIHASQARAKGWRGHPREHAMAARGISSRNISYQTRAEPSSDYFRLDTGMPIHQNMMENPEYFREHKGIEWKIVWMSPDQYERAIDKGLRSEAELEGKEADFEDVSQRIVPSHLEEIERLMMKLEGEGKKIDMPSLRYATYVNRYHPEEPKPFFTQEGHHRTVAARNLGENLIPVLVEFPSDPRERILAEQLMTATIRGAIT